MKTIEQLKSELALVYAKIKRLETPDSYFDSLSRSFHLGMVGGSGKNTYRLNKRRERSLDKTIENAKELCELYRQRDMLKVKIQDIENNGPSIREQRKQERNKLLADYWRGLKVGDELNVGNSNGNPIITKKSGKSCYTGPDCKWTAAEIIGKDAAALL